jgi:hypothetical protein
MLSYFHGGGETRPVFMLLGVPEDMTVRDKVATARAVKDLDHLW